MGNMTDEDIKKLVAMLRQQEKVITQEQLNTFIEAYSSMTEQLVDINSNLSESSKKLQCIADQFTNGFKNEIKHYVRECAEETNRLTKNEMKTVYLKMAALFGIISGIFTSIIILLNSFGVI